MSGYIRQKDAEIVDDAVIFAEDLKVEFDTIQAAMDAATGHSHAGGVGEGAPITVTGPAQDFIFSNTLVRPKTTAAYDVGSGTFKFKDGYFSGTVSVVALTASGVITGNGSGLTNLPAASLTGTIADARIPTAIVRDSRLISTGSGLTGGGSLAADRTLAVDSTVIRTTGNQTLGGTKTFSSTIIGNLTGNVNGNLTGDVTGNLTGTASNATTAVTLTGLTSTITQLNSLNNMSSPTVVDYVTEHRGFTYTSQQATTSGTAFDFLSLPSWVNELVLLFSNVGLSSTGNVLVQLGNSGGLVTSGYTSSSINCSAGNSVDGVDASTGFVVFGNNASVALTGIMHLVRYSSTSDFWVQTHTMRRGTTSAAHGGGIVDAGALTRVRLTRNGSDTFDTGTITLGYR